MLQDFNRKPQNAVLLRYPNPNAATPLAYRLMEVSAADAGWRLIGSARELLGEPISRFGRYNKRYPESNVPLSFVLENSIMVARAMDQCTALYMFESSLVATRMRVIILVLIATIILIEIALIAVIFHRAVARQFKDVNEAVEGLKEISPALVRPASTR